VIAVLRVDVLVCVPLGNAHRGIMCLGIGDSCTGCVAFERKTHVCVCVCQCQLNLRARMVGQMGGRRSDGHRVQCNARYGG